MIKTVLDITALASGTSAINVAPNTAGAYPSARVSGTAALTGTYNISPTGTPIKNSFVEIYWEASLSNGASNAVAIFGKTVPAELITSGSKFKVDCLYNGTAWVVDIMPDDAGTGIVGTARIADDAVTLDKMAGLAKGKIIYGDASGNPADIELGSADARMLLGDTTNGVAAVDMSGDATLAKTGALTIANNAVTTAKILDANVTNAKIADDAVTAAKLDDDANRTQIVIPVSFESAGEIGAVDYKICFPCTIEAIHGTVTKVGTSTRTHVFKDNGGTVLTGSQIDMASGLLLGNIVSSTPTANNAFVAGDVIRIETSVSGAVGGKSTIVLCALKS